MKTTSKIFAVFFILMASVSGWFAYNGATHQWPVFGVCSLMALVLLHDAYKNVAVPARGNVTCVKQLRLKIRLELPLGFQPLPLGSLLNNEQMKDELISSLSGILNKYSGSAQFYDTRISLVQSRQKKGETFYPEPFDKHDELSVYNQQ